MKIENQKVKEAQRLFDELKAKYPATIPARFWPHLRAGVKSTTKEERRRQRELDKRGGERRMELLMQMAEAEVAWQNERMEHYRRTGKWKRRRLPAIPPAPPPLTSPPPFIG